MQLGWWNVSTQGFQFDQATHTYYDDGVPIISVTQVIHSAGLISFEGINPMVLERKRQLGGLVHQACHFIDEDDLDLSSLPQEVADYVAGYVRFREEAGFFPELNEHRMVASVNGMKFGMTVDKAGPIYGEPYVIELKCGADEHPAWGVQLAAYDMGLSKPTGAYRTRKRGVVQLKPDGTFKVHTYTDPADAHIFMASLAIANWKWNKGLHISNAA